jgi:hypothetical protein
MNKCSVNLRSSPIAKKAVVPDQIDTPRASQDEGQRKARVGKLERIKLKLALNSLNKPAQTFEHPVCNLTLYKPGNYKLFTTFKLNFSQDSYASHNLNEISGLGSVSTPRSSVYEDSTN